MQIPAQYCGVATDVRKVVRKQVRAIVRGATWLEATAGPMVNTSDVPGLIYLHGPTFTGTPKAPQIYLYMLLSELARTAEKGQITFTRMNEIRMDAILSAWGAVAMLAGVASRFYIRHWPEYAPELLRVGLERWEELDSEGPRYASATEQGRRLWEVAYGFHFAMRLMGVGEYPAGHGIVFEPRTFLAEHGLLDKVMAATAHP